MMNQNLPDETSRHEDGRMINQMFFTKLGHLEQLIQGVTYESPQGDVMNNIIDSTVVAAFVRTIFETVGVFNTIYVKPQSEDERIILYNLWSIAGLSYRQTFLSSITSQENLQKSENERQIILNLKDELEHTNLFINLSQTDKDKIFARYSRKEFAIRFDEGKVKVLNGYQDWIDKSGIRTEIMGNMYTYFSLHAHPSNVSVFTFAQMFKHDVPVFRQLTNFNLSNVYMLLSVFIADFIQVFPDCLATFETLSIRDQIIINFFNTFSRNHDYSINDCFDSLED